MPPRRLGENQQGKVELGGWLARWSLIFLSSIKSELDNCRAETRNSSESERSFSYESPSFQARYDYYDGTKHERDYLYPTTRQASQSFFQFYKVKVENIAMFLGGSVSTISLSF